MKKFTVKVGHFDASQDGIIKDSYKEPVPLFAYETNSPKQAARILAELINGRSARAEAVQRSRPLGHGMKYVIAADGVEYSLRLFRATFLA